MRTTMWELKRGKETFYYDNYDCARLDFIATRKANEELKKSKNPFTRRRAANAELNPYINCRPLI